jgi:hypothetical protein
MIKIQKQLLLKENCRFCSRPKKTTKKFAPCKFQGLLILINLNSSAIVFSAFCHPECQNGGVCVSPFKCQCPPGTSGKHCQKRKLIKTSKLSDSLTKFIGQFFIYSNLLNVKPLYLFICHQNNAV